MYPAIFIPPAPAPNAAAGRGASRKLAPHPGRVQPAWPGRRSIPLHLIVLGLVLAVSLALRLWGIRQGLPYSYNSDEATHFVPTAIGFLGGDLNPHYFLNPPAYTYLVYLALLAWFGGGQGVHQAFGHDPAAVYVVARVLSAVLGTLAVWLTYLAGVRLFGRWAGVVAGAVLGMAFLPVFYGHLALNDAPAVAPVALALVGCAGIVRRGRAAGNVRRGRAAGNVRRGRAAGNFGSEVHVCATAEPKFHDRPTLDYALAGLGIGLAAATKYTAGFVVVCLLGAFACDVAGDGQAIRRLALALAVALAVFVAADPYAVLDLGAFLSGLSYQAGAVGVPKLGASSGDGWLYYLWTLTWGLGWAPALAALAGSVWLVLRRRWAEALVLLPAVVGYVLYMGDQQRFFGRWLMPMFPLLALLAGFAVVAALRRAARRAPRLAVALVGGMGASLLIGQSVAADVHDDRVLSRPATLNLTRAWMVSHIPPGTKVVIEPVVPGNWAARWRVFPVYRAHLADGSTRPIHVDQYESHLSPALLSAYTRQGYCWVLTASQQSGRAFVRPAAASGAVAYYAALARRERLLYHVSPFAPGSRPPAFNFDWSFEYYPGQYRLPGPEVSVYRLRGGRCGPR